MKRNCILILIGFSIFLAGCGVYEEREIGEESFVCEGEMESVYSNVSFGYYHQPEHLISASEYIIHGKLVNRRTVVLEDDFDQGFAITTIQEVEVTEVLKGNVNVGDVIEIHQGGGVHGCFEDIVEPSPLLFTENQYYLLFLTLHTGIAYLTTPYQSVHLIPEGGASEMEFSFHIGDDTMIDLTYDELLELRSYQLDELSLEVEIIVPETTPRLYVNLHIQDLPLQKFRAAQLSGIWDACPIDAMVCPEGSSYSSSADHPLDFWVAEEWDQTHFDQFIAYLKDEEGKVELQFTDNFPPDSITVRRWRSEFAGMAWEVEFQYEPVEIEGHVFHVTDDRYDYIYEVNASWEQGYSSYAFRINSGE